MGLLWTDEGQLIDDSVPEQTEIDLKKYDSIHFSVSEQKLKLANFDMRIL